MPTKRRALPVWERDATAPSTLKERVPQRVLFYGQILLFGVCVVQFIMLWRSYALAAACGVAYARLLRKQTSSSSSSVPDYYQTVPELFPGTYDVGQISAMRLE